MGHVVIAVLLGVLPMVSAICGYVTATAATQLNSNKTQKAFGFSWILNKDLLARLPSIFQVC